MIKLYAKNEVDYNIDEPFEEEINITIGADATAQQAIAACLYFLNRAGYKCINEDTIDRYLKEAAADFLDRI